MIGEETIERLRAVAQVAVVRIRQAPAEESPVRRVGADRYDGAWVAHGKRTQNQLVGQAEYRAVGPDPERERDDRDAGEHGIAPEQTTRVADVAQKIGEPGKTALIAQRLHRLHEAAGADRCGPCGVLGRGAAPLRVLDGELHVQPQLLFQVAICSRRTKRSPEADDPLAAG